jgi:hypothetical protein
MKLLSPTSSLALLALACALPAVPQQSSADVFRGKVTLRGVLVSRGQVTDISANFRSDRMVSSAGREIRMSGGGLYTLNSANPTGTYSGRTKRITNKYGKIRRVNQKKPIQVSRRSIVFPDGRIRLSRPINVTGAGRYRLKGTGRFRVNA